MRNSTVDLRSRRSSIGTIQLFNRGYGVVEVDMYNY